MAYDLRRQASRQISVPPAWIGSCVRTVPGIFLTVVLLAGCGGEDAGRDLAQGGPAPVSTSPPVPADGPSQDSNSTTTGGAPDLPVVSDTTLEGAADSAGEIPASTPLTAEGWGPLRIGMTLREVVSAAGEDANPDAVGGPDPAACDEFRPRRAPAGLLVMLEEGRLTRISVGSSSRVATDSGIGIGDDPADVRRVYGDRVEVTPHKYVAAPAAYLTVWTVAPPAPDARGLVFEVGQEGRISRIHAGGPSIQYVEGCL